MEEQACKYVHLFIMGRRSNQSYHIEISLLYINLKRGSERTCAFHNVWLRSVMSGQDEAGWSLTAAANCSASSSGFLSLPCSAPPQPPSFGLSELERTLAESVTPVFPCHSHISPLSWTWVQVLLNSSPSLFNFLYRWFLKLLVSITPSWMICPTSLICYSKPGNERLGAVIFFSCLVPVWPAFGLSNDLFKGLTGRANDERTEDGICL